MLTMTKEVKINLFGAFKTTGLLDVPRNQYKEVFNDMVKLLTYKLIIVEVDFKIRNDCFIIDQYELNYFWQTLYSVLNYFYDGTVYMDDFLDLISESKVL